jgi:hypothetical protein
MRWIARIGPVGTAFAFIAVIAGAAALAFLPGGGGAPGAPAGPRSTSPAATRQPTLAPQPLAPPANWSVEFFSAKLGQPASNGPPVLVPRLEFAFPGAPFGDFADNAWYVVAEAEVSGGTAPGSFTLEYQGEVTVFAGSAEIARQTSTAAPTTVTVTTPPGGAFLRIVARDAGGPFLLRWK